MKTEIWVIWRKGEPITDDHMHAVAMFGQVLQDVQDLRGSLKIEAENGNKTLTSGEAADLISKALGE